MMTLPPKQLERNTTYFELQDIEEAWNKMMNVVDSELHYESLVGEERYGKKLAEIRDALEAIMADMRKVMEQ